jgi:hypothetical protein
MDLPKPTQALQARKEDLGIDKNLGKTIVVNQSAGGKGPGFYVSRKLRGSISSWRKALSVKYVGVLWKTV